MENTNINIKQIIVSAGIALVFMTILVGGILVVGSFKKTTGSTGSSPNSNDDMASMHAPPVPADDTKFKSLLGKTAPGFSLTGYDGKIVDLVSLKGKNVVIFFSEGAMCYPSCWDQINEFTKDKGKFDAKNTVVLTIVVDPKNDWGEAVKKDRNLANATVLLDSDRKVSDVYGALTVESSMHRGQYPGHTYLIIDKEGVVKYEYDDPQMGVRDFEILSELSKLI